MTLCPGLLDLFDFPIQLCPPLDCHLLHKHTVHCLVPVTDLQHPWRFHFLLGLFSQLAPLELNYFLVVVVVLFANFNVLPLLSALLLCEHLLSCSILVIILQLPGHELLATQELFLRPKTSLAATWTYPLIGAIDQWCSLVHSLLVRILPPLLPATARATIPNFWNGGTTQRTHMEGHSQDPPKW